MSVQNKLQSAEHDQKSDQKQEVKAVTLNQQTVLPNRNFSRVVPLNNTTSLEEVRQQPSTPNNLLVPPTTTIQNMTQEMRRKSDGAYLPEISNEDHELVANEPINNQVKGETEKETELTPEEIKKLEKILSMLKRAVHSKHESDVVQSIIEEKWQDPTPNLIEGIFHINQMNRLTKLCTKKQEQVIQKTYVYDYRSLYCLHFKNPVRIWLVAFSTSTMFDNFIILIIFMNSIVLAIYDYNDRDNELLWNQRLENIGHVFTILFAFEMFIKILAQGFILHYNAYLRDAWNWLDFVVVVTGIMEMLKFELFKVRALRTLRVLRPLRSIKSFPKIRQFISSLVGSIGSLLNAVVFMLFIFMLFGILGIQQFQGSMYQRCRLTEEPLSDGSWPFDPELDYLCSEDGQGLMECPADTFCKQPADAGLGAEIDVPINQELIVYNMMGFDHLGWAMLTIFQMITLEQWTTVMYLLMDSNIWWMAVIFAVSLVLIGSFFLLNVILAVLAEQNKMVEQIQNRQDTARLAKIRQSLQRAEAQKDNQKISSVQSNNSSNQGEEKIQTQQFEMNQQQDSQGLELLGRDQTEEVFDETKNFKNNSETANRKLDHILVNDKEIEVPKSPSPRELPHVEMKKGNSEAKPAISRLTYNNENDQNKSDNDSKNNVLEHLSINADSESQHKDDRIHSGFISSNKSIRTDASMISTVPDRASKNRIYYICFQLCTHWSFTLFITLLIIANTVVLALDKYPEDPQEKKISEILNEVFTWAFVIEMVIKLFGLGFKDYAKDSFNLFDALIVVLSIVDMILTETFQEESPTGALSAFRGVRLLRVFKLARSWTSFRVLLSKILSTLKIISPFSVLMLIFMFIFSLLGMELFGYKVQFYKDLYVGEEQKNYDKAEPPRPNFNNLMMGFTSIFAIAIGDDWNLMMAMAYRAEGFVAIIFYLVVFIFMNLMLLNLFLAILLENFDENTTQKEDQSIDKAEEKTIKKFQRRCNKFCQPCTNCLKRSFACCQIQESDSEEEDAESYASSSMGSSFDDNQNSNEKSSDSAEIEKPVIGIIDQEGRRKSIHKSLTLNDPPIKDENMIIQSVCVKTPDSEKKAKNSFRVGEGSLDPDNAISSQRSSVRKSNRSNRGGQRRKSQFANRSPSASRNSGRISGQKYNKIDGRRSKSEKNVLKEQKVNHNIPGNQQGKEICDDGEIDRTSVVSKSSQEKKKPRVSSPTKDLFKLRRFNSTTDKAETSMAVNQISSLIPQEYAPKNLRKVFKKRSRRMTLIERKRLQDIEESTRMLAASNKLMSMAEMKKMELIDKMNLDTKIIKLMGRSLFCFSKNNWIRNICYNIVKHSWYDSLVIILIGISTVLLTIDNPNIDGASDLAKVLKVLDYVLTSLFTIECLINIILFGLICNGKSSYARDAWNIMDLLIVAFSIFTIILQGQGGDDLSILKVFRMLRVLRPLRFLKRNLGLKIQVVSLMNAVPGIANLLMISLLILGIFGIQAVGFLKGTFYYCDYENIPEYAQELVMTRWDCYDFGGDWINKQDNFDNVRNAIVTMFGMITTEGWLDVMWSAVDATKINQEPARNNEKIFILFFMIFMVVNSLFILNLFVGVVINTFNIEKEKLSRNNLLTDLQVEYTEVLMKCYQLKPLTKVIETGNKCRDQMNRIAHHPAFEIFIFGCICSNTVVLALSWYGMDQSILDVLEILNYIFTSIYTIEMIIKMIAFGKGYFKDGWCLFDFLIVISAWIGIILLKVFNIDVGSISTIIRSFRIARVLKLIKTAKNLQQIFQTFILAIPELMNVGALLILFLFLFAVLGVSLFAEVKLQETMNRHASFRNFGQAILTLLRVATGEGWVGIMQDAARNPSILFNCVEKQTYEQKINDGIQGCGNQAAYVYFVAFNFMVSLVFLNLFIAIILEGFAASAQEQKIRVGDECFEAFQRAWLKYDPEATEMMNVNCLESLILDLIEEEIAVIQKDNTKKDVNLNLHKFLGLKYYTKMKRNILDDNDHLGYFKDIDKNKMLRRGLKREMRRYIRLLQVPLYDGIAYKSTKRIQFHDTLNGIIYSVYKLMHKKAVKMRDERIETKIKVGEKLVGWESVEKGSEQFWEMVPREQEKFLELTEKKFQKVINRLENKGNIPGQAILKLEFMRRLRKKAGTRFSNKLFVFQNAGGDQQHVFDSSHFVGASIILSNMVKKKQLAANRVQSESKQKKNFWETSSDSSVYVISRMGNSRESLDIKHSKMVGDISNSMLMDEPRLRSINESDEHIYDPSTIVINDHTEDMIDPTQDEHQIQPDQKGQNEKLQQPATRTLKPKICEEGQSPLIVPKAGRNLLLAEAKNIVDSPRLHQVSESSDLPGLQTDPNLFMNDEKPQIIVSIAASASGHLQTPLHDQPLPKGSPSQDGNTFNKDKIELEKDVKTSQENLKKGLTVVESIRDRGSRDMQDNSQYMNAVLSHNLMSKNNPSINTRDNDTTLLKKSLNDMASTKRQKISQSNLSIDESLRSSKTASNFPRGKKQFAQIAEEQLRSGNQSPEKYKQQNKYPVSNTNVYGAEDQKVGTGASQNINEPNTGQGVAKRANNYGAFIDKINTNKTNVQNAHVIKTTKAGVNQNFIEADNAMINVKDNSTGQRNSNRTSSQHEITGVSKTYGIKMYNPNETPRREMLNSMPNVPFYQAQAKRQIGHLLHQSSKQTKEFQVSGRSSSPGTKTRDMYISTNEVYNRTLSAFPRGTDQQSSTGRKLRKDYSREKQQQNLQKKQASMLSEKHIKSVLAGNDKRKSNDNAKPTHILSNNYQKDIQMTIYENNLASTSSQLRLSKFKDYPPKQDLVWFSGAAELDHKGGESKHGKQQRQSNFAKKDELSRSMEPAIDNVVNRTQANFMNKNDSIVAKREQPMRKTYDKGFHPFLQSQPSEGQQTKLRDGLMVIGNNSKIPDGSFIKRSPILGVSKTYPEPLPEAGQSHYVWRNMPLHQEQSNQMQYPLVVEQQILSATRIAKLEPMGNELSDRPHAFMKGVKQMREQLMLPTPITREIKSRGEFQRALQHKNSNKKDNNKKDRYSSSEAAVSAYNSQTHIPQQSRSTHRYSQSNKKKKQQLLDAYNLI